MPRPTKAVKPVEKNISLPVDLCTKVDLALWSDLEGRVPYGSWSKLVEALLTRWVNERAAAGEATMKPDTFLKELQA